MEIPQVDFTFIYLFLFFAIPGLIFRKLYFQGEFSKQFVSKNWAYTLTTSFILGIVIQIFSFYSVKGFFAYYGKPHDEKYLISLSDCQNIKDILSELTLYDFGQSDKYLLIIVGYIFLTCIMAFLLATICWHIVRRLKFDRKFRIFRFSNIWNYYLRGEIVDFKDFITIRESGKKVLLTVIDVLISDGFSQNKLFSGILTQYTINSTDNSLETITLTDAHVWKTCNDESNQMFGKRVKTKVKGHCVLLDMKRSIDLNITYVFSNDDSNQAVKTVIKFANFFITLSYLFFIIYIIVSSSAVLIVNSIINTIILKLYFIVLLTLCTSLIFNFLIYLEYRKTLTEWQVKEKIKGGVLVTFFIFIIMCVYRLIRYSDIAFWSF